MKPVGNVMRCLLIFFAMAGLARAASKTISTTASVPVLNTLTGTVKKTSDNSTQTSIAFGSHAATSPKWSTLAEQHVLISVSYNIAPWRLRIRTDNFSSTPSTTTWGWQYGGMIDAAKPGALVALAWRASTVTTNGYAPSLGDPSVSSNTASFGWTYVKDRRDRDLVETGRDNESFTASDEAGYCNVAFGDSGYTMVIAKSRNVTEGTKLPEPDDSFKVFIEANFNGVRASSAYTTDLEFDLLNE